MTHTRPLWILTHPRTASTYLASLLSHAMPEDLEVTERYIKNPKYKHLRLPDGVTPRCNKVFPDQYKTVHGDYNLRHVEKEFPNVRYVHLVRHDKVAQAMSYLLALNSDVWNVHPDDPDHLRKYQERIAKPTVEEVRGKVNWFQRSELLWHRCLGTRDHLTISFEELTAHPMRTLNLVLHYIDGDMVTELPPEKVGPLTDNRKELWVEELRAELGV